MSLEKNSNTGFAGPNGEIITNPKKPKDDVYAKLSALGEPSGTADVYEDAMSKALKAGNYDTYLNGLIQNANAQRRARNLLHNSLASQGISTQGAGMTASTGLSNSLLNANNSLYQNLQSLNAEADQAALERQSTAVNSDVQNFLTAASALDSGSSDYQTKLSEMLQNHGFGTIDADGNFTPRKSFNSLTVDQQNAIKDYLITGKATGAQGTSWAKYLTESYDGGYGDTISTNFKQEIAKFDGWKSNLSDGDYIQLTNNKGYSTYFVYHSNGSVTQTSADDFAKNGGYRFTSGSDNPTSIKPKSENDSASKSTPGDESYPLAATSDADINKITKAYYATGSTHLDLGSTFKYGNITVKYSFRDGRGVWVIVPDNN